MAVKARTNAATSVWADAEELPRAGTADVARMERRAKMLRRYMVAASVLLPFALLALAALAGSLGSDPVAATEDAGQRAAATAAVTRWLSGNPAPLPGGRLATWDGQEVIAETQADPATDTVESRLEEHSFTVLTGTGARMSVQVLVRVSGPLVQIAGAPALSAVVAESSDPVDASLQWPGTEPGEVSDPVSRAVDAWADAYTSGDPAALRQTVGDPDAQHTYLPLSGLAGGQARVGASAWLTATAGRTTTRTGFLVVRVTVALDWSADTQAKAAGTDYDLLVADAATAAPKVVAWGGPGTGPLLTPYVNAVTGIQVEPAEEKVVG